LEGGKAAFQRSIDVFQPKKMEFNEGGQLPQKVMPATIFTAFLKNCF